MKIKMQFGVFELLTDHYAYFNEYVTLIKFYKGIFLGFEIGKYKGIVNQF